MAIATGTLCIDGPIEYKPDRGAHVSLACRQDRISDWYALGGNESRYNELLAIVAATGMEAEIRYDIEAGCKPDERQLFFGAHGDVNLVIELFGTVLWNQYREKAHRFVTRPEIWNAIKVLAKNILTTWPNPVPANQAYEIIKAIEPATPIMESVENEDDVRHCDG